MHNAASPDAYVESLAGWQRSFVVALHEPVTAELALDEQVKWGHFEPRLKPGGKYEMATPELKPGTPLKRRTVAELVARAVALNARLGNPCRP